MTAPLVGLWFCLWMWSSGPAVIEADMRAWALRQAPRELAEEERIRLLHRALVDRRFLALEEERGFTATAREAFARKKANCVAFALLFGGLARSLGIEVEFALDRGILDVEKRPGFRILHGHLAVRWGKANNPWLIDAQGFFRAEPGRYHRIDDTTLWAIFYSNRGSEQLFAGQREQARRLLELALRFDPSLAAARHNFEVVSRLGAASRAPEPSARLAGHRYDG